MTQERWDNLIKMVDKNFGIKNRTSEEIELGEKDNGEKLLEKREIIEFESPMGRLKIERSIKPRLLDKKTIYSKRIGSETKVEYIYSDEETVDQMKAYKWGNDNWAEITYDFNV